MANVYEKLMTVQTSLKVPKGHFNKFGNYKYRNCEDILEGLKPHLKEVKAALILSDKVEFIEGRHYVVVTASFIDIEKGEKIEVQAQAREDETKKGMDLAQITGSVSSYARKYALNGLFCIDDTKDADANNTHDKDTDKDTDNNKNLQKYTDTNKTVTMITEPQVKDLGALMRKTGMTKETANHKMQEICNKTSVKDLTEAEASKLIAEFEKISANVAV